MTLTDVVKWGFTGMVTVSCTRYALSGRLKDDFSVFAGHSALTWAKIVLSTLVDLTLTVTVAILLMTAWPKVMEWSWLSLLASPSSHETGTNLNLAGAQIPYFGILFLALLFVNLPRLARYEEEEFREGTRDWRHAIPRSLGFGLAHCFVGVPLGAGFALAIPGLWFTLQYFKGGVSRSTLYHSVSNMIVLLVVTVFVIIDTIKR